MIDLVIYLVICLVDLSRNPDEPAPQQIDHQIDRHIDQQIEHPQITRSITRSKLHHVTSFDSPLINPPVAHYEAHALERGDVVDRIAVDGCEVGRETGGD